jgi:hypothetical protein
MQTELLKERLLERQLLVQDRSMTEAEREAFLARFSTSNRDTLVGLAVMGAFSARRSTCWANA